MVTYGLKNFKSLLLRQHWFINIRGSKNWLMTWPTSLNPGCLIWIHDVMQAFADSLCIPFIETSAKDSINVEKAFLTMCAEIKKRYYWLIFINCCCSPFHIFWLACLSYHNFGANNLSFSNSCTYKWHHEVSCSWRNSWKYLLLCHIVYQTFTLIPCHHLFLNSYSSQIVVYLVHSS